MRGEPLSSAFMGAPLRPVEQLLGHVHGAHLECVVVMRLALVYIRLFAQFLITCKEIHFSCETMQSFRAQGHQKEEEGERSDLDVRFPARTSASAMASREAASPMDSSLSLYPPCTQSHGNRIHN